MRTRYIFLVGLFLLCAAQISQAQQQLLAPDTVFQGRVLTVMLTDEEEPTGAYWEVVVNGNVDPLATGTNTPIPSITYTCNTIGLLNIYRKVNSTILSYANIRVIAVPPATLNVPASACKSIPIVYTTDAGKSNYIWTANGASISGSGSSVTVTWTTDGSKTVSVQYTDNGVTRTNSRAVDVNGHVTATPTITGPCLVDGKYQYTTAASMLDYTWSISGGGTITPDGNKANVTWTTPGSNYVSVNYKEEGCPALTSGTRLASIVAPLPQLISGPTEVCVNTSGLPSFSIPSGTGRSNYSWTATGSSAMTSPSGISNSITWNTAGNSKVTLSYKEGTCSIHSDYYVKVNERPTAQIDGPSNATQNTVIYQYKTELFKTGYTWNVDTTGTIVSGQGSNEVNVRWTSPGVNYISVSYTDSKGCLTNAPASFAVSVSPPATLLDHSSITTTAMLKKELAIPTNLVTAPADDYKINKAYFDGLGRPIQNVDIGQSPQGKDVVLPMEYDEFGREVKKYLPYVINARSGEYISTAIADQSAFYQATGTHATDTVPYAVTVFEASPLNRVIEQGAPGVDWQPGTNHTIRKQYLFNGANDVIKFTYDQATATLTDSVVYYDTNALTCTKTIDEHQNDVLEYVDKEGRTVCKKVKEPEGGYAQTYYVYDAYGNLVVVIPPEGVKQFLAINEN